MDNLLTKEQIEVLEQIGCKFTPGGSHSSRTVMLTELKSVLEAVPAGSPPDSYRLAIGTRNVLGKGTDSTRQKSLRHLRELCGTSEAIPIFAVLRRLYLAVPQGLPLLAFLCAWSRDPLLRATTSAISAAPEGSDVTSESLSKAIAEAFPSQYSEPHTHAGDITLAFPVGCGPRLVIGPTMARIDYAERYGMWQTPAQRRSYIRCFAKAVWV